MYVWNDKICFKCYRYDSNDARYDVYSSITGEVFGDIVVNRTITDAFKFQCDFDDYYIDTRRFFGQGFAVRNIHVGFGYIAKNLYSYTKLKYGKKFWGSE